MCRSFHPFPATSIDPVPPGARRTRRFPVQSAPSATLLLIVACTLAPAAWAQTAPPGSPADATPPAGAGAASRSGWGQAMAELIRALDTAPAAPKAAAPTTAPPAATPAPTPAAAPPAPGIDEGVATQTDGVPRS